jgi:hypothetical protein
MQDFFNLVMLVLASVASMLLGVLAAYGICRSAFGLMHWHASRGLEAAAKPTTEPARVS